jgi:hypothetical protein
VLQVSDSTGDFADPECLDSVPAAVRWIPACAGMTIMPVYATNLITASEAGIQ